MSGVLKPIRKDAISRPDERADLPAQAPGRWRSAADTAHGSLQYSSS